jgi:hypothetical protein
MRMVLTVDIEVAMTIKNMLAMAVADAPETLYKDFSEARALYIKSLSEAETKPDATV